MAGDRILIVLDDTFDDPELDLPRWIKPALVEAESVHLLAPYVGSRVSVATDDDDPRRLAARRLDRVNDYLRSIGTQPTRSVSADGPFDAVMTYLLEHDVDRITIVLTAEGSWRERDLLEKLSKAASARVEGIPAVHRGE
jgi:hypothetical protein